MVSHTCVRHVHLATRLGLTPHRPSIHRPTGLLTSVSDRSEAVCAEPQSRYCHAPRREACASKMIPRQGAPESPGGGGRVVSIFCFFDLHRGRRDPLFFLPSSSFITTHIFFCRRRKTVRDKNVGRGTPHMLCCTPCAFSHFQS